MAKCKHCGRSGLFLRLDKRGHCPDCAKGLLYALYDICTLAGGHEDYKIPHDLDESEAFHLARETSKNLAYDCGIELRKCRSSASPDFFYEHYDVFKPKYDYLQRIFVAAPFLFDATDFVIIDDYQHANYERLERHAWENYYNQISGKLDTLSTQRGRQSALNRFCESVRKYDARISDINKSIVKCWRDELVRKGGCNG